MATTITLSQEMKTNLKNLGRAGESYEDVIRRMYDLTKRQLLMQYLYDASDSVTLDDFEAQVRAKLD
jgi:predicted CopG family antitoxin